MSPNGRIMGLGKIAFNAISVDRSSSLRLTKSRAYSRVTSFSLGPVQTIQIIL